MTQFMEISIPIQVLCALATVMVVWVNAYLLIGFIKRRARISTIILTAVLLAGSYILLQIFILLRRQLDWGVANYNKPFLMYLLPLVFLVAGTVVMIRKDRLMRARTLSPGAVKEAVDYLETGICCYEMQGRVILKNRKMETLCRKLTGHSLRFGDEFYEDVCTMGKEPKGKSESSFWVFTDGGEVWQLSRNKIQLEDREAWLLLAINITDEYAEYELLRKKQVENESLASRYEEFRSQIRDNTILEETLQAKVRIHDDIGETLLACKKYLTDGGDVAEATWIVQMMRRNNALLKTELTAEDVKEDNIGAYERVFRTADNVGVALCIDGELPTEATSQEILAVAIHECITNTLRHAKGNNVFITVREVDHRIEVCLQNDGMQPQSEIVESGGLGSLRKIVERAGGEMKIDSMPCFRLSIILREE